MELTIEAFGENLNSGRETLVNVEQMEDFSLTPGASASNGHGCCSSSTPVDEGPIGVS